MPLVRQYNVGDVEVLVWKITEPVDILLRMVSSECATYAMDNFASGERCSQWLAVRAIVSHRFAGDVRIVYDEKGKPVLDGHYGNISISHTKGYAVLLFSPVDEAGVDVELLSRDVVATARRFMPVEQLDAYSPSERNFVALFNWCAKEALYKITGDLGGCFKDNISVASFKPQDSGCVRLSLVGVGYCGSADFVGYFRVLDDLLTVVCTKSAT